MNKKTRLVKLSLPLGLSMEEVYAEYTLQANALRGIIPEASIRELLDYVARIDQFGTFADVNVLTDLWWAIVSDPLLQPTLFYKTGSKRGTMNRYRVIVIVEFLMEHGFYVRDQKCPLANLYYALKGERTVDAFFTSKANYSLKASEKKRVLEMMRRARAGADETSACWS